MDTRFRKPDELLRLIAAYLDEYRSTEICTAVSKMYRERELSTGEYKFLNSYLTKYLPPKNYGALLYSWPPGDIVSKLEWLQTRIDKEKNRDYRSPEVLGKAIAKQLAWQTTIWAKCGQLPPDEPMDYILHRAMMRMPLSDWERALMHNLVQIGYFWSPGPELQRGRIKRYYIEVAIALDSSFKCK